MPDVGYIPTLRPMDSPHFEIVALRVRRVISNSSGSHALIRHPLCSVLCSTRQLQFFSRRTAPGLLKECQHRRYLVVDLLHGSFRGAVDNCPVVQLLEGKAPGNKSIAQGLCSTADFHGAELLGRANWPLIAVGGLHAGRRTQTRRGLTAACGGKKQQDYTARRLPDPAGCQRF